VFNFESYQHFCLKDESACLPPIIPNGPIAIYGLVRNYVVNLIPIVWEVHEHRHAMSQWCV